MRTGRPGSPGRSIETCTSGLACATDAVPSTAPISTVNAMNLWKKGRFMVAPCVAVRSSCATPRERHLNESDFCSGRPQDDLDPAPPRSERVRIRLAVVAGARSLTTAGPLDGWTIVIE